MPNMTQNKSKRRLALICVVAVAPSATAFTPTTPSLRPRFVHSPRVGERIVPAQSILYASTLPDEMKKEAELDQLLESDDGKNLDAAVKFLRSNPDVDLTRERWNRIFDAIEVRTSQAEENTINLRMQQEMPLISRPRTEMANCYRALSDLGHLKLFGAVQKGVMPAAGGHNVSPTMLENISSLSMKALTPKPTNTVLYAGIALAVLEGLASVAFGFNLNFLVFLTVAAAVADRVLVNGAVSETAIKLLTPETQPKITRHEAGHFLCAYLLGCPVEGYVLSAWAALQDARFSSRSVSAGTSFFDPILSSELMSAKVTRSSIDRYSIIVMAGIAAEAVQFGRADGGGGDEMALIAFLSQMNGSGNSGAWNPLTIRNQARWGALQAVLIIREYKECYDALVDALERNGSLGDCIYAIENAARLSGKGPLTKPLGYIVDRPGSLDGEWMKELPQPTEEDNSAVKQNTEKIEKPTFNPEESMATLEDYKKEMQEKLKAIEQQLEKLE